MKHTLLMLSTVLILSSVVIYASDYASDEEHDESFKAIILRSRTDQDFVTGSSSIQSINFDKEKCDDNLLHETLTQCSGLRTLSAQQNQLKNPQPVACEFLTTLNFSHGNITKFSIGDWAQAMPSLRVLNLAHNKIVSIASDFDANQLNRCGGIVHDAWHSKSLQKLDLSHNELAEFDLNIINNAPSVTKANFSHNNISDVAIPLKLNNRKTCTVYLQNNKLDESKKQLLVKKTIHDTPEYKGIKMTESAIGVYLGAIPAAGTCLGLIMGTTISPWFVKVLLAVGAVLIVGGGSTYAGYKIGECTMPKSRRTYKSFEFTFESSEGADDVIIDLEQ